VHHDPDAIKIDRGRSEKPESKVEYDSGALNPTSPFKNQA